jgi:hypothetical protein
MRALVVGTLPSSADRAATLIREAGHEVVRCHETGHAPFPCAALDEERGCPLESSEPVDVAVTVRDRAWPRPSPLEDGVTCAIRRHIPVVVAGAAPHPFTQWMTEEVGRGGNVVAACERAAAAPLVRHGEIAAATARGVLERGGIDASATSATVHRVDGKLHVDVMLPDQARELHSAVAAKVLGDLREYDRYAFGIDVSIVDGG